MATGVNVKITITGVGGDLRKLIQDKINKTKFKITIGSVTLHQKTILSAFNTTVSNIRDKLSLNIDKVSISRSAIQNAITNSINQSNAGLSIKVSKVSIPKSLVTKALRNISNDGIKIKITEIDALSAITKLEKKVCKLFNNLSFTPHLDINSQAKAFSKELTSLYSSATKAMQSQQTNFDFKSFFRYWGDTNATLNREYSKQTPISQSTIDSIQNAIIMLGRYKNAIQSLPKFNTAFAGLQNISVDSSLSQKVSDLVSKGREVQSILSNIGSLRGTELVNAVAKLNLGIESVVNGYKEITTENNNIISQQREQRREANTQNNTLKQTAILCRQIASYLNNNTRLKGTSYETQLNSLLAELRSGNVSPERLIEISTGFQEIRTGCQSAGLEGKAFFNILQEGWQKFGGWSIVTRSMMFAYNSIKKVITAVTGLDTAMTELKKVTDAANSTYNKFIQTATNISKEIGSTLINTINATSVFARLGESIDKSATYAKAALVYLNVGDEIDDVTTAAEALISTMKAGFKEVDQNDPMAIVDKYNEVGNNFAISSGGIGTALTRSASSLAAANNTLDESIGLIVAMNNVIQDPEVVGTTIKTSTMYLRAAKDEAEAAGESVEGMANSVSSLRQSILKLTDNKVDIMVNDTTFKSTFQVYKELSKVWKDLSDVNQANIIEKIGGKRNANAISALLNNFSDAEAAAKTAAESTGSAMKENAKYLESYEGRMSLLNAEFESVSNKLAESDFFKFFIDSGTSALKILGSIADGLGGLPASIGTATAMLTIFLKTMDSVKKTSDGISVFGKTKSSVVNTFNVLKDYGTNGFVAGVKSIFSNAEYAQLKAWTKSVNLATLSDEEFERSIVNLSAANKENATAIYKGEASLKSFKGGLISTNIATKALTIGMKVLSMAVNTVVAMGVSWAIQGIISLFTRAAEAEKEQAEAATEAIATTNEAISSLEDYKQKIIELRAELDSGTLTQSEANEKRKELISIQDELVEKYAGEESAINNVTKAIQGQTDAIDELSGKEASDWLTENQSAYDKAKDYMTKEFWNINTSAGSEKSTRQVNSLSGNLYLSKDSTTMSIAYDIYKYIQEHGGATYFQTEETTPYNPYFEYSFSGTRSEMIAKLQDLYNYIRDAYSGVDEATGFLQDVSDHINYIADDNYYDQKERYEQGNKYIVLANKEWRDSYNELLEIQDKYNTLSVNGDTDGMYGTFMEMKDKYTEIIGSIGDDGAIAFFNSFWDNFQNIAKYSDNVDKVRSSLEGTLSEKVYQLMLSKITLSGNKYSDLLAEALKYQTGEQSPIGKMLNSYADQMQMSVEELLVALSNLGYVVDDRTDNVVNSFNISKYSEDVSNIISNINTLQDAYDKLQDGKLGRNDVMELIKEFPSLAQAVDWTAEKYGDLGEAIKDCISEQPQDLIATLESIDTSTLSAEDLKNYNVLLSYLEDIQVSLEDIEGIISKIKSAISNVSGIIQTLHSMKSGLSENGALSLSDITTILTDDTYVSLRKYIDDMDGMSAAIDDLMQTQKNAYEDMMNYDFWYYDYEEFKDSVDKKASENSNFVSDTISEIEYEYAQIEKMYDVDLSNYNGLSETKKEILANTNVELLIEQRNIINDIKDTYDVDLENYKSLEEAKLAIFVASAKKLSLIQSINAVALGNNNGQEYYLPFEVLNTNQQKQVQSALKELGMTYDEFQKTSFDEIMYNVLNSGVSGDLEKQLYSIFKGYEIPDTYWDDLLKDKGSKSSSFSNEIDWIERRLKRFARTTEEVFSKVADYVSYESKNSQLSKTISAIGNEIQANQDAYNKYMSLANSVSLSSYYKQLVRDGKLDISKITDENLYNKIQEYQNLYEKALDCKDAIEDLKDKEYEYSVQKLTNIQTYYNNVVSSLEKSLSYQKSLNDYKTNSGQIVTSSDYQKLISYYNSEKSQLEKERTALTQQFNALVSSGVIKKGSDDWYEWNDNIAEITNNLLECDNSVAEIKDNIRDIPLNKIDNAISRLEHLLNMVEGLQSFHEGQGIDLTAQEYYDQINKQFELIQQERKYIQQVQSDMTNGKYGVEGSDKWNEALSEIESRQENILSIMTSQEQEYDAIIDLQIESLQKQKEELQNTNDELERQLSLEKAIEAFEKARFQKNKLVYHEGIGFVYEADRNALRDAQEALDDEYYNQVLDDFDKAIDTLEELKKTNNIYNYNGAGTTGGARNDNDLVIPNGAVGLKGYANGGVVNYTGIAKLHGANGAEMVLNNADVSKLYSYIHNTPNILKDVLSNSNTLNKVSTQQSKSILFQIASGAITLNGVQDVSGLSKAIINNLPNQLIQDLYK